MSQRTIRGASLCAVTMALAMSVPAFAQAQTPEDDTAAEAEGVGEIVVTAQKRSENVQDIPIAINALGGDDLQDRRVSGADDLVRQFPNLSLKQSSAVNSGVSIRGVGTQNIHLTAQQAVGQYLDEVSLVTPFSSAFGLFDLERVEILRGPQNTLFGRNTTGGAINYVTRRPKAGDGFNGYAMANLGRFNRIDVEGAIGVPLGDTVAIRVAGQMQTRDGVFKDIVTGGEIGKTRRYSGRFGIAWDPDSDTSVFLSGHVGYNRGTDGPRKAIGILAADGVSPCPELNLGDLAFREANGCLAPSKTGLFNPSTSTWRAAYHAADDTADVDFEGGSFRFRHDFGGFSLTSISSFDHTKLTYSTEAGGLPYTQFQFLQNGKYDVYSHETRIASESNGPFKWILGGYWSYEKDNLAAIVRNNVAGPPAYAVVPMVSVDQKAEIVSFYGQADYELTDRLKISAGIRWTSDKRKGLRDVIAVLDSTTGLPGAPRLPADFRFSREFLTGLAAGFTAACAPGVVGCRGPLTPLQQNVSKVAGKVSLDYEVADDVMAYASYSRGFKSGSFDIRAQGVFNGTGNTPVGPETLDAYEVGIKSRFLDRKVQFNVSAFRYDWKDLQAFGSIPVFGPAFINLPKSRLTGAEFELKVAPGGGFSANLSGGYLDTEVLDTGILTPATALVGSPLQQSPKWTFNGDVNQAFSLGDGTVTARLGGRYVGVQYNDLTKALNGRTSSAFFADASLGYEFGDAGRHQVSLYVDNLTAEKTCTRQEAYVALSNTNTCIPNEGAALYGLTLRTRW
jgi:iron complex outermembrane recepter protein